MKEQVSPEPLINAAIAAMAAQQSALFSAILSVVLIILAVVIVVGVVLLLVSLHRLRENTRTMYEKVASIEEHTNSMREQLVVASRKLGQFEGEVAGRAAERESHDAFTKVD